MTIMEFVLAYSVPWDYALLISAFLVVPLICDLLCADVDYGIYGVYGEIGKHLIAKETRRFLKFLHRYEMPGRCPGCKHPTVNSSMALTYFCEVSSCLCRRHTNYKLWRPGDRRFRDISPWPQS